MAMSVYEMSHGSVTKIKVMRPWHFVKNTLGSRTVNESQIIIYGDSPHTVEVRLEGETVWLNQGQMTDLFGRERSVIGKHIRNVFAEGELDEKSNVQNLHITGSDKPVRFYNLDVIISVGYRVKSLEGTRFRQWATHLLRQHLSQGYTLDTRRLAERGMDEVRAAVTLAAQTLNQHAMISDDGAAVLSVVRNYLGSFSLLLAYDENRLPTGPREPRTPQALSLSDARTAISSLRNALVGKNEATQLFALERDDALTGILAAVEQTMFGEMLYPSAQARAAHILYFIIKDHPFTDGNKRIGTLLFLEYLRQNALLYRSNGEVRFAENAIVALALLIAESAPPQKDLMVRLTLALMDEN
jgi:prophage maintenance system killer protein